MKPYFKKLLYCICLLSGMNTSVILACSIAPAKLTVHHTELVKRTENIILAKAIAVKGSAELAFKVINVLKGHADSIETIPNGRLFPNNHVESFSSFGKGVRVDFNQHRNLLFWDKKATRVMNSSDCQMYPSFQAGKTYLIFLGAPHWRAYEEIKSDDDLWLKAVQNLVANPELKSGLTLDINEWVDMSKLAFTAKPLDCDGVEFKVGRTLNGDVGEIWQRVAKSSIQSKTKNDDCDKGNSVFFIDYLGSFNPYGSRKYAGALVENMQVDLKRALKFSEIDFNGQYILNLDN